MRDLLAPVPGAPPFKSPTATIAVLQPYWASRWHCIMACGVYMAGTRQPPGLQGTCAHCGKQALLEQTCQGMTTRVLPFFEKPTSPFPGMKKNGAQQQWWCPTPRRVHRKGGKRKAGEKDKVAYIPMAPDEGE